MTIAKALAISPETKKEQLSKQKKKIGKPKVCGVHYSGSDFPGVE